MPPSKNAGTVTTTATTAKRTRSKKSAAASVPTEPTDPTHPTEHTAASANQDGIGVAVAEPPTANAANAANANACGDAGANEPASHIILQLPIPSERVQSIVNGAGDARVDVPSPYTPGHSWTMSCLEYDTPPNATADQMVCYHCCHSVTTKLFGMPVDFDPVHHLFHVYGHFCSLNCAAAFNMSTHMGSDRMWDIHSWIQMMAQVYQVPLPVRPAPSRYVLKMFGGPLSIEEFRASHQSLARTVVLNVPPLVSVQPQVEWVNTSFLASSTSAPIAATAATAATAAAGAAIGGGAAGNGHGVADDADRPLTAPTVDGAQSAANFPKLSRRRAVVDSKRTLESKMNLTVSVAS